MATGVGSFILGSVFVMSFFAILSVITFVFWIIMLIDCIKRNFKKSDEKLIWVLVIILAGIVGAIVYYFVVKRNSKR